MYRQSSAPETDAMTNATLTTLIEQRMKVIRTRRGLAASAAVLAIAAGAIGAYAEFTSSPSATGAAAAVSGQVTIAPTRVGPLSPQLNPADTTPITVTVDNTSASNELVGPITGSVRSSGGCLAAWFTVAPVAAPGSVSPGTHTYPSSVILNDDDRNQTACNSVTETIDWTSASGR
jgi:hypothetical protein